MRARDTQRAKVYKMEHDLRSWMVNARCLKTREEPQYRWDEELTEVQVEKLVRRVWRRYAPAAMPPSVAFSTRAQRAWGSRLRISIPTKTMRVDVVLHEVAHSLHEKRLQEAPHGPEFVRLYFELLAWYTGVDIKWLKEVARAHKVKYSRVEDTVRPKDAQPRVHVIRDAAGQVEKAWWSLTNMTK